MSRYPPIGRMIPNAGHYITRVRLEAKKYLAISIHVYITTRIVNCKGNTQCFRLVHYMTATHTFRCTILYLDMNLEPFEL